MSYKIPYIKPQRELTDYEYAGIVVASICSAIVGSLIGIYLL